MAISGTVPEFDYSQTRNGDTPIVARYSASGAAITRATESLPEAFLRYAGVLGAMSGIAGTSGTQAGQTRITAAQASGLRDLNQEFAARYAELTSIGSNADKLALANALLTASGEFRFSVGAA
jgi:hypothetical protein